MFISHKVYLVFHHFLAVKITRGGKSGERHASSDGVDFCERAKFVPMRSSFLLGARLFGVSGTFFGGF